MVRNNSFLLTAGAQANFDLSPSLPGPPNVLRELPTKVEQRRAKDLWKAAHRLKVLVELWARFTMMGLLRLRLEDSTEAAIVSWFPELSHFGVVLDALATPAVLEPEEVARLAEFDQEHQIRRGPTARHQTDDRRQICRTVQPLLESFRNMMLTEADCLHRLEANQGFFRRSWGDIKSDIERLTGLSVDWTENIPILDFGELLSRKSFREVRARLSRELNEMLAQLEQYPQTILCTTSGGNTPSTGPRPRRRQLTKTEADRLVMDYLSKHPDATSEAIAKQFGCSGGLVRGTNAWKLAQHAKRRKATRQKPPGQRVGLEIGVETVMLAEFFEKERATAEAEETVQPSLSREEELAKLITEQEEDARTEQRKGRRKRN